jgi:D-alanyl-D-alanine carboxypeptidase/D-alanyl-D-alanine-endopeptidase (penicillin-binding protein 4)
MIVSGSRLVSRAALLRASAVLLLLLLSPSVLAAAPRSGLPPTVRSALRSAGIAPDSAALFVQQLGAPSPAVAYNVSRPMNPASTIKLVTTLAALELLGPSYTWKTDFYADGALQGDTLGGDLIMRGTGDPKLTLENFWLMLRALRGRGLREIRGDLVLDRSYFAAADHDPASFDKEPARPYNVGPDALLVNYKSIRFHFVPEPERRIVQIIPEPALAQLQLTTSVAFSDEPCGSDWRARLKGEFQSNDASARANFTGTYPAACGENTWNVAMLSHSSYVWGLFRQLWTELGGAFKGGVRDGRAVATDKLLYTAESPPLAEVVRDMNKFSNNVMARQVFLALSAEMLKMPASTERSVQVIRSWLSQKNLRASSLVLENGSGLSRNERISAAVMGELLLNAWESPVMPEFVASLPLVAYDGTMRKRLRLDSVAGQAHIKTGSLSGVRAVAGYVLDREGRRFVVVFFVNHPNAAAAEPAQDALLRWVYEEAAPSLRGRAQRSNAEAEPPDMPSTPREPADDAEEAQ